MRITGSFPSSSPLPFLTSYASRADIHHDRTLAPTQRLPLQNRAYLIRPTSLWCPVLHRKATDFHFSPQLLGGIDSSYDRKDERTY